MGRWIPWKALTERRGWATESLERKEGSEKRATMTNKEGDEAVTRNGEDARTDDGKRPRRANE